MKTYIRTLLDSRTGHGTIKVARPDKKEFKERILLCARLINEGKNSAAGASTVATGLYNRFCSYYENEIAKLIREGIIE